MEPVLTLRIDFILAFASALYITRDPVSFFLHVLWAILVLSLHVVSSFPHSVSVYFLIASIL